MFQLEEDKLNEILQYLASRPFIEVHKMVGYITNARKVIDDVAAIAEAIEPVVEVVAPAAEPIVEAVASL